MLLKSSRKSEALQAAALLRKHQKEKPVMVAPCGRLMGTRRLSDPVEVMNLPNTGQNITQTLVVVVENSGTPVIAGTEAKPTVPPVF